jgi:putative ABC transport system permease protein
MLSSCVQEASKGQVVLNALPFRDADRLMAVWSDFSKSGGNRRAYTAPADYFDWKERSRSFAAMTAYRNTNRTLTALDQPLTLLANEVPANYFDVLGVQAVRGRTFVAGEDQAGTDRVVVISHSLWRSVFNGSDDVIGKTVELDGRAVQLIGVLPPGFRTPNNAIVTPADLWIAASFDAQRLERVQRSLVAFGRLKPGVTPGQAEAEMAAISEQIAREHPQRAAVPVAWARTIREDMTGEFRGAFLLLLGAVGMMLLIACANVANLLLARAAGRAREVALRTVLGASRAAIVRQMLTESALLALIGGAVGIVVAQFSIGPLLALIPAAADLPFAENVRINLPVLAFAMGLSLLTAILFGLAPARQALHASLIESLKEGGRSRTGGREGARWRNALIVVEVGLSIVLLTGAGLMIQTFWRLSHLNLGFDASRVLNVRNSLRGATYATPKRAAITSPRPRPNWQRFPEWNR